MISYSQMLEQARLRVGEKFPWEIEAMLATNADTLLLDVREPHEFDIARIDGSINVPRGILESACEYDFEETLPELVQARGRHVVVICRSGYRSLLAADVMQNMGYRYVISLKTGIRGWNDAEQPLVDVGGKTVAIKDVDEILAVRIKAEQLSAQYRCT